MLVDQLSNLLVPFTSIFVISVVGKEICSITDRESIYSTLNTSGFHIVKNRAPFLQVAYKFLLS